MKKVKDSEKPNIYDETEKKVISLKKAHNKLVEIVTEITEEIEKIKNWENILNKHETLLRRQTKKMERIDDMASDMAENHKNIKNIAKHVGDVAKKAVTVELFNQPRSFTKDIAQKTIQNEINDFLTKNVYYKTKSIKMKNFKTEMFVKLNKGGWRCAAILDTPIISEPAIIFEKQKIVDKKIKKIN